MITPANDLLRLSPVSDSHVSLQLLGKWRQGSTLPDTGDIISGLTQFPRLEKISFDSSSLKSWDSILLITLTRLIETCEQKGVFVDRSGLPQGVKRLLMLASAVPEKKGTREKRRRPTFLAHVGEETLDFLKSAGEIISFLGESTIAVMKLFTGKARYRSSDLTLTIQECGVEALPIVSLISLLVGLILAFIGAIQLEMFGAEIYVADLVGIAMVRVMGSVMTGVIMAGRTGAAFAAQIGTMEVNEEIDALKTLGISPVEFLVLPRMLGMTIMMPMLCLYANLMGILGGLIVGVTMLDVNLVQYYLQTRNAVGINDLVIGIIQGVLFGILVALTGCLRGMQCGRSAAAVGNASTSAVVTGIVAIVVTTALVTIICSVIGV
ncbi:MAG: ABC transporter permease [Desulfobacteraceae bacterium]|nr:MAG: ABC transporter permease [Desulfobacteraceae bacterium]